MSSGRERVWRSERASSARRSNKKAKLYAAVSLLSVLIVALVVFLWPASVPPFRMICLAPVKYDTVDQVTGKGVGPRWATPLDLGAPSNARRFEKLMTEVKKLQPELVGFEKEVSVAGVQASEGQTLIYCSIEARVVPSEDQKSAVLELLESPAKWTRADNFFKSILPDKASGDHSVVVLLELENQGLELNRALSGPDSHRLLEDVVKSLKDPRLVVITACGPGQRSWEYQISADAKSDAADSDATAIYDGTAFGHFVYEAIRDQESGNAMKLHQIVEQKVRGYVKEKYNARQDVQIITGGKPDRVALFTGVRMPSSIGVAELASSAKQAEAPKQKPESADDSKKESPKEKTVREKVADGREQLKGVEDDASGAYVLDVWRIQATMFLADQLLDHGRKEEAELALEQGNYAISKLKKSLAERQSGTILSVKKEGPVSENDQILTMLWLGLDPALTSASGDADDKAAAKSREESFRKILTFLRTPEAPDSKDSPPPFPYPLNEAWTPTDEDRQRELLRFQNWLVRELRVELEGADSLKPEERATKLKGVQDVLTRLFKSPVFRSLTTWQQTSRSFSTLRLILNSTERAVGPQEWDRVKLILRLLKVQERALILAVGVDLGDQGEVEPIQTGAWEDLGLGISGVLEQLTAAESWLTLLSDANSQTEQISKRAGEDAERILSDAEGKLSQLKRELDNRLASSRRLDRQRVLVPYLLQYFAIHDEFEKLTIDTAMLGRDPSTWPGRLSPRLEVLTKLTLDSDEQTGLQSADTDLEKLNLQDAKTASEYRRYRLTPVADAGQEAPSFREEQPFASEANTINTGIWAGFWSIRLLQSLEAPSDEVDVLWSLWDRLKAEAANKDSSTALVLRAQLFEKLEEAWVRFDSQSGDQPKSSSEFVSDKNYGFLLNSFAGSRRTALLDEQAKRTPWNSGFLENTSGSDYFQGVGSVLYIRDQETFLEVKAASSSSMSSNRDAGYEIQLYLPAGYSSSRSVADAGDGPIIFSIQQDGRADLASAGTKSQATLLLVSKAINTVVSKKTIELKPIAPAKWKLRIKHKETELYLSPDNSTAEEAFTLNLPPFRLNESLSVEIEQLSQAPGEYEVEVFALDSKNRPDPSRVLMKQPITMQPGMTSVPILLSPAGGQAGAPAAPGTPAAASGAAVAAAVPATPVLENGFALRVTSKAEGLSEVEKTQNIVLRLNYSDISNFVVLDDSEENPGYDKFDRTLSIRLEKVRDRRTLTPEKIPVKVHFSPELRQALPAEIVGDFRPDISNSEPLVFVFSPEKISELKTDGGVFALSVGDLPYVWAWRLKTDGSVTRLGDVEPEVLLELDTGEITRTVNSEGLLFDKTLLLDKGTLKSRVYIYGQTSVIKDSLLDLQIVTEYPPGRPAKPLSLIDGGKVLTGPWKRRATLSPGEAGAWQLKTEIEAWESETVTNLTSSGVPTGRYRLEARMSRDDEAISPAEAKLSFVIDGTPPEKPQIRILGNSSKSEMTQVPHDRPLKGTLENVLDPESGVVEVRLAFSEEELVEGNPYWSAGIGESSRRDKAAATLKWELSPAKLGPLPPGDGDSVRKKLIVQVKNRVGETARATQEFDVLRPKKTEEVPIDEARKFSVIFVVSETKEGTVIVELDNNKRELAAGGKTQYTAPPDPAKRHVVRWYIKGSSGDPYEETFYFDKEGAPKIVTVK